MNPKPRPTDTRDPGLEPAASDAVRVIDTQAAAWVQRRDAGLTEVEQIQLRAWLAADPRHGAALAATDSARTPLDWPLHSAAMDEVLAGLEQRARRRHSRRCALAGVASIAAAALLAVSFFLRRTEITPQAAIPRAATLIVVEARTQTLPDGSLVQLKDDAEIGFDFSGTERRVALRRGTVHFSVAKNPARPFIVSAGGVAVRAIGTAFCVEVDSREVAVVVTEGRVAVEQPASTSRSPAGQNASPATPLAELSRGKAIVLPVAHPRQPGAALRALADIEIAQRLAWRIPRLEFTGTPLPEVVAMINRHNTPQFVLADQSLDSVVLSGVMRADKIDALIDMLASDFNVRAERNDGRIVLRHAESTRP